MSNAGPIEITISIATNIASSILVHHAYRLENTLLGRGLKFAGLIPLDFYDRLRIVIGDSVKYFFDRNPIYRRQSIIDFLQDRIVSKQIADHILERKPINEKAIMDRLKEYL